MPEYRTLPTDVLARTSQGNEGARKIGANVPGIAESNVQDILFALSQSNLSFRGEWTPDENYQRFDIATYNGSAWIALRENEEVAPVVGQDWGILAEKGASGSQGPQGLTGSQGPTGPAGPAGRGFTPRGTWASSVPYNDDDIVVHNGSAYRVITDHTSDAGETPDATPEYYELLAAKGDQGEQGLPGDAGQAATETIAGVAEVATQGEVNNGSPGNTIVIPSTHVGSHRISAKTAVTLPASYTATPSFFTVAASTSGYPTPAGMVFTLLQSNTDVAQMYVTKDGSGNVYLRHLDTGTGDWSAWVLHSHAHSSLTGIDTDSATTAIHHTLGTGANQAAAGNDSRFSVAASETVAGHAELATQTEVNTGTDTTRIVTPAALAGRTATETRTGVAELATQSEVNTGTDDTRIVTSAKLAGRTASDILAGIVELATIAETQTGTDTSRAVTPAGVSAVMTDHLNDASDVHDASAISYAGGTGIAATDVEGAIDELATEKMNVGAFAYYAIPFAFKGPLVETIGTLRAPVITTGTIVKVRATVGTASSSGTINVDVNLNGTSIWATNQANRIGIASGSNANGRTTFDTSAVSEDDYVTVDIDTAGTGAADLTVFVKVRYAL